MNLPSLWEMTKGRWREFRREPSAFFFVIAMPLLWMLILGHALQPSGEQTYKVGFMEHGETNPQEAELKKLLQSNAHVVVLSSAADLKKGNIPLYVELMNGVLLYHENTNHRDAVQTQRWLNDLIQTHLGRKDPMPHQIIRSDVGETRYVDFLIPGLLALSIFTTSLFGTGMTIVANRRENLLKRYAATPMNSFEYILSHIFGRFFIYLVEFSTIAIGGYLFFGFNVVGSWLDYAVIGFLGTATFTSLSTLFSSRTKNTAMYNGLVNLITLTMMFPAGVWFSRSNMPTWMQTFSEYLPLTALVEALRGVALEGLKLSHLSWPISILLLYTVGCALMARKLFRWY